VPATLNDVARRSGVSTKTVSRVVNHERHVHSDTRERVLLAIEELGYRPNAVARSLVRKRSLTIGVLTYGLERYAPSRFLIGAQHEAAKHGYALLLALLQPELPIRMDEVLEDLLSRRVDGIIWQAPDVANTHRWITPQRLAHMPPIVLSGLPNPHVTTVTVDNYVGGLLAVEHLLAQQWQRIGYLAGPAELPPNSERWRGWHDALCGAGREPDESLVVSGVGTAQGGAGAMSALLGRRPDVDAVFCFNDAMALGAMRAATLAGRRPGVDLGVVGYDDVAEAAFYTPPLTTVRQRNAEMGVEAVRALVRAIELQQSGDERPVPLLIQSRPELVVRESSLPHGVGHR
jgi:LacI family transcriptional regulator